jgi:hypothetical protein
MEVTMNGIVFWDVIACGLVGSYLCFGGTCCLSLQSISFIAKKEAECSSQTLVTFYYITWCHIPEDRNLQKIKYFSHFTARTNFRKSDLCLQVRVSMFMQFRYIFSPYLLTSHKTMTKTENLYIYVYICVCIYIQK